MKQLIARIWCWWVGCVVDWDAIARSDDDDKIPCLRCGAPDTNYEDRIGYTRRNRTIRWLRGNILWRLIPQRCDRCGKRFGKHEGCDDIPF